MSASSSSVAIAGVADLSALRKWMVIGNGARAWLESKQIAAPAMLMRSIGVGLWAARVGARRYLISEDASGTPVIDATRGGDDVVVIAQDWVEFGLFGALTADILSELCSTDLAQYGADAWIPTLLADAEVAIYRPSPRQHYRVVCTPAEGHYVFSTVAARVEELGGELFGFDDYCQIKFSTL